MKKIVLLGIIAVSLAFTSCDDGKKHCWEITYKGTFEGETEKGTFYEYGTADQIDAEIKLTKIEAKEEGIKNLKITKKKLNLSEADCWAKNDWGWDDYDY